MSYIFVSGGLGFIGSHTVIELINSNYNVVIVDDLSNSKIEVLDKLKEITSRDILFYQYDILDKKIIENLFKKYNFAGIMHFAGLKSVSDSVEYPLSYYLNNLLTTVNLLSLCIKYNVKKFIFSSSATVYGDNTSPLKESMPLMQRTNPYGETKAMNEKILTDVSKANPNLEVSLLRYFNPIGAHKSGLIGENPHGTPNNLLPYITKVAKGILDELSIFGDDYDTIDGTGIRDYIHVVDLAKGHIAALIHSVAGTSIYNLGTGKGTSVFEIVKAFEMVNNICIPYKIVGRRSGDLSSCYADVSKANKELNWSAEKTIEDMVKDAWFYEKKQVYK